MYVQGQVEIDQMKWSHSGHHVHGDGGVGYVKAVDQGALWFPRAGGLHHHNLKNWYWIHLVEENESVSFRVTVTVLVSEASRGLG